MIYQNKVELIGFYGSDETHALSAWTSTGRELTEERKNRMGKLLKTLAENGHHTPFEKSLLHFLVVCDTASHIQLLKHRIGVSINAESARYKELKEDKFYIPIDWPEALKIDLMSQTLKSYNNYHRVIRILETENIDRKRAKESARFFLPYANQLTLDISFNFRSFMHFQGLRNKSDAQLEIKNIAEEMLNLVINTNTFPHSLAAFGYA